MNSSSRTYRRVFLSVFLVFSSLSIGEKAKATEQCIRLFTDVSEEARNKEKLLANHFNIGRRLLTYDFLLAAKNKAFSFAQTLKSLVFGAIWIDMGAGEARALKDALDKNSNFLGIAVSFKKPESFSIGEEHKGRLKYLDGDFVENMFFKGRLRRYVGRAKIVSDIVGPLSYSKDIQTLFEIYFQLLEKQGHLYFSFVTEKNFDVEVTSEGKRKRQQRPDMLRINRFLKVNDNGEKIEVDFLDWLKTVKGIQIDEETTFSLEAFDSDTLIIEKYRSFRLTKISDQVTMPYKIVPISYKARDRKSVV